MKSEVKAVCRVCLQCDLEGDVSSIFDESDKGFIYEKLNSIAEVHIKPEDGLPDKICAECLLELENAIHFKQKCETSNSILVSAASAGDGLKGEGAATEDVKPEPDDCTEHDYREEAPASSPEPTLKPEETEEQEQPPSPAEIRPEPTSRPSRAINMQLECHDCGNLFKSKCKLKVHWFKVHLKAQLTCNICRRKFKSFKTLNAHKASKLRSCMIYNEINFTGEGKYRVLYCKHCDYSTTKTTYMMKHMVTHTGEQSHACKLCPKRYTQYTGLLAHVETKHNGTKRERMCGTCGEVLQGYYEYTIHTREHRIRVTVSCKVCNKMVRKSNMENHMATHANDRPFTCDVCAGSFKTFSALYGHKRTVHDRIIHKYKCNLCGYTTRNHATMKKHRQKHSEKTIACVECGNFFDNEFQLSLHKEKHRERTLACPQCDLKFLTRNTMLRHINNKHKIFMA